MARTIIQHIPIDAEWVETLVGLCLNIPNRWWPGYDDCGLNRGHIAAIDFNASNTIYFQVELDNEPGVHYAMGYDSVFLYTDEEQPGFLRGEGDVGVEEGDADSENLDDNDMDLFEEKRYEKSKQTNWTMHQDGRPGRVIHPILFTGQAKFFCPNVSNEELKGMIDENGDVRFAKVFEWMLPRFDSKTFFEYLSARMRNFMVHTIKIKGWMPKPNVLRRGRSSSLMMLRAFFDANLRGVYGEIHQLNVLGRHNAFEDIYICLHVDDNWDEDDEWEDVYTDAKKSSPDGTAHHRRKFSLFEDGFNHWWKECVTFGQWLTFDKSRVAGWYHSPITQGPDPKPIRTDATIHSLVITHGNLASNKVHVRVFGGAMDNDLGKANENTITTQSG
ncbi:hypothetical protein ACHAW5_000040 [Stephanodiscus triporus]|uniref:Uncharacterized protein n=1 Tax=Stephanodiscus triporus TaxID=2934178 RepID=A0ABD3MPV4_9STRA